MSRRRCIRRVRLSSLEPVGITAERSEDARRSGRISKQTFDSETQHVHD